MAVPVGAPATVPLGSRQPGFSRVKPKLALYTHFVLIGTAGDEIVPQTRTTYQDHLEAGEDLMSLTIDSSVSVKRWDADVGAYPK
jgi:ribonuclease Z